MKNLSKEQQQKLLQQIRGADCKLFNFIYDKHLRRFQASIKKSGYTCTTEEVIDAFDDAEIIFFEEVKNNKRFKLTSGLYTYLFKTELDSGKEPLCKNHIVDSRVPTVDFPDFLPVHKHKT